MMILSLSVQEAFFPPTSPKIVNLPGYENHLSIPAGSLRFARFPDLLFQSFDALLLRFKSLNEIINHGYADWSDFHATFNGTVAN
jgi:hypothetical protein